MPINAVNLYEDGPHSQSMLFNVKMSITLVKDFELNFGAEADFQYIINNNSVNVYKTFTLLWSVFLPYILSAQF